MSDTWLNPARAQFSRLSENLPHALLVQGAPGVGKHLLAWEMAAALLCDAPSTTQGLSRACGECKNCRLFESDNHPDFHYVSSERFVEAHGGALQAYAGRYLEAPEKRGKRKPRKVISVDQIRALIDHFVLSNHSARYKVALIEPADSMNINAANALLKLLEEPGSDSVLILVSSDPGRLPMTIRSRCIGLLVEPPDLEQATSWLATQGMTEQGAQKALAICGGAPLTALDYTNSGDVARFESLLEALAMNLKGTTGPVETRERLLKLQSPGILLNWLQMTISWLLASVEVEVSTGPAPWKAYHRVFNQLSRGVDETRLPALFSLYDELLTMKKQDLEVVNAGLLLDKWLILFSQRLN